MKLKPFSYIRPGKYSSGITVTDDEPRADMFMPASFFIMGLLFVLIGGIFEIVFVVLQISVLLIVFAAVMVFLGVALLLCWKNQTIRMVSDDAFEYSTFLGNKTIYYFNQIKGMKINSDSATLFVADGKVHIDSVAVVTERLEDRINKQLEEINGNE